MTKITPLDVLAYYAVSEESILKIADRAAVLHAAVNQRYGHDLPYAFHLRLTADYALRFAHEVLADTAELETLMAAAYFHDTLEDARLTYNDLKREFTALNEAGAHIDVALAAEIVYALTNEKGRTREERAGAHYYEGIRRTPYAPFLKACDRLANLRYSTLFYMRQRMAEVYRREMPHFLSELGGLPQSMEDELRRLADKDVPPGCP